MISPLLFDISCLAEDGYTFKEIVDDFIDKHKTDEVIDKVLFFHLTRRLEIAKDDHRSCNLYTLLTEETALSTFLKKHDIEFLKNDGHLEIIYRKNRIPLGNTPEASYLKKRLGYIKNHEDYCINRFAFKDLLYKNHYTRDLVNGAEFIGRLAVFLKNSGISKEYYKSSTYFCYEYCVPIERIIFDASSELTGIDKEHYFLHQVIYRLYEYIVTGEYCMYDSDNPILRLKEDDTMDEEFFVAKAVI